MTLQVRAMLKQVNPANADAVFRAGAAAVKQDLAEEALPLMQAGAKAHPNDARMWQLLGLAYRRLDDLAPAIEALAKAAALAPADALIAHTRARATLEAGLAAVELFETAHRLAPNDGTVLLGRAAAQVAVGRLDEAIADLQQLLDRNPGWLEGHDTLARLRWMGGDSEGFTTSFERALAAAPKALPLWQALIHTLMNGGPTDRALAAIARGRAAAGANPVFDAAEAICLDELGRTDEAATLFDRLGPPQHIGMVVRHVRHLLRTGRPKEAAALAEMHRGNDPDHLLWPYLATAWRLVDDERWQWVEGDPRFVGIYDLAEELPPLDLLAEHLRALHLTVQQPLEQSVRGGTQTDGPLFSRIDPVIRALRQAVVEAVETHVAQLPPREAGHPLLDSARRPIRFAGSWSVRLTGGGSHANHVHTHGWLSSALYVALSDEAQRGTPPAGWLTLGAPQAELGIDLPPFRTIEPRPGRLVLFPSTMWHGTVPFAEGERLTIAFDVARPAR